MCPNLYQMEQVIMTVVDGEEEDQRIIPKEPKLFSTQQYYPDDKYPWNQQWIATETRAEAENECKSWHPDAKLVKIETEYENG